ncbi:MAG: VWFA superfamily protein, DUF58-containing [Candidatus Kaiserbacteria bacterium GW2011_GWC2_52_8b]|uniref:VWFA superfamily protein, DUF58-containing n=2 Tax=Candidatus Kaiseribacteriota TaxID=1752734 RepID=A0A0G1ZTU8_9BACT|nr:MAG: VWFA superfamily protein, DUF58-containing [Candidatus Kaiserbacteria bacterium GW2011_GWC2_52_8b]
MWGIRRNDRGQRELRLAVGRIVTEFSSGMHQSVTKGRGIEVVGYRQYDHSDTARDIAWRASARLPDDDDILSQNFAPEKQMRILMVVDEGHSMRFPRLKPLYADALVRIFASAALDAEDLFSVVGVEGDGMIYSDQLTGEGDLNDFLKAADEQRQRRVYRADVRLLPDLLNELDLKNTLVIFLTDFVRTEWIPFQAMREIDPLQNVRFVAVVLDEWSGFAPTSHSIMFEHVENGMTAVLDMRRGGGVEREVHAFRERLRALRNQGNALGLSVITVPLADENPLRMFYKQWERLFEEN